MLLSARLIETVEHLTLYRNNVWYFTLVNMVNQIEAHGGDPIPMLIGAITELVKENQSLINRLVDEISHRPASVHDTTARLG